MKPYATTFSLPYCHSLGLYKRYTALNDTCIMNKNNFELQGFVSKRWITGVHKVPRLVEQRALAME